MPVEFRLSPPRGPGPPPVLDPSQRAVVDHENGPLLVLAGPGTGKTTTIVELVVDRLENRGYAPEEILVLTFSRKAAAELRVRIARRRTAASGVVQAATFHAFCYALVRQHADPESFAEPATVLSAPEQDALIAELLAGHQVSDWPVSLQAAVRTRGFAAEVQNLMAVAARLDLGPGGLSDIAVRHGRDDWQRVARFMTEYEQLAALSNLTDHTDVIAQAVDLAHVPRVRDALRQQFRLVVVDEYQDTDPLQVALLRELAGEGRDLVVVGDPDQSIYGFRGADPSGIVDFPDEFRTRGGNRAPVLPLRVSRRLPAAVLAATRAVIEPAGVIPRLGLDATRELRDLASTAEVDGDVTVETYATPAAEAEAIAARLRAAHLRDGLAWSDMAVLVRTAADISRLRRILAPAGVPVEVSGDELPLAAEPAVRQLLTALEVATTIAAGQLPDPDAAHAVLSGPLGGLDATALRRLGRALRRADADHPGGPRPSVQLIASALARPTELPVDAREPSTRRAVEAADRLAARLAQAARVIAGGEPVEQALWALWNTSDWSRRLVHAWESGGEQRAVADRDLDAVCALFSHAARVEENRPHSSSVAFIADLRHQEIPADRLAGSAERGHAVRIMTAHRAKGLEWPLVVVSGVAEGVWPDVRARSTLLQAERLGPSGMLPRSTGAEQAREERRLFYVACTRASRTLVVTAVQSGTDGGDEPSRFVTELRAHLGTDHAPLPRPPRPLSLRAVIAELRSLVETGEGAERAEAAALLADLAGRDLRAVAAAHPSRWWGMAELTDSEEPWRDPSQPLHLSASAVSSINDCSLRWFLSRQARGSVGTSTAQGFGSIVHALAADVVRRGVVPDPQAMADQLDAVWSQLDHPAAWISSRERQAAGEAITRFARWHATHGRMPLAAEYEFAAEITVADRPVVLSGSMDRVELDTDGRVHVIDLKTSKNAPRKEDIVEHAQLGFYQVAVDAGATSELAPDAPSGGAELVQLRIAAGSKNPDDPTVQSQDPPSPDLPFFALDQIRHAVEVIGTETITATPENCQYCQFTTLCPTATTWVIGSGGDA